MAANDKDTIYIDIDDEITGIIDKLKGSNGKIVALVLPKRASVFQSIVNMKLLKRAADESKKHLVLITTEAGLMPLAGMAGVHVAKTLNSKPEVPIGPDDLSDDEESVEEDGALINTATPVGELAGLPKPDADGVETIELDDDIAPEDDDPKPKTFTPPVGKTKGKKDKKFKIPDFNKFRLLLIIGGLALILLIVGSVFAIKVLPKATISIKTDATTVPVDFGLNLSTTATALKTSNNTIPAKYASQQKTYSQQVTTTGQKNNGNKASGTVSVTNCNDDDLTIAAGTGFSANGNTYISQASATIPHSSFKKTGACNDNGKADVSVIAQNSGSAFNLPGNSKMTIAGGSSDLSASSGTISGGTDSIVQTVNQNDITSAKSKITTTDAAVKTSLQNDLKQGGYYVIDATYTVGTPAITNSANVGDVANTVTVTEVVTYSVFGVKQTDLKSLVDAAIKKQIDESKQTILDDGISKATFNVTNTSPTAAQITMATTASAGPDLNEADIKTAAAGKKSGAVESTLKSNPDVTDVDVKLSPFWVSAVPSKPDKITVKIAAPTAAKSEQ